MFPDDDAAYLAMQKAAINAIRRGDLTPGEVARLTGLSHVTIHRWCKRNNIDAKKARERRAAAIWHMVTDGSLQTRTARRAAAKRLADEYAESNPIIRRPGRPPKEPDMKRSYGSERKAENPHKETALANIKAGKYTVAQAAKYAGVPISGMVGWMKLAKMEIPEEYNQPRRKRPD